LGNGITKQDDLWSDHDFIRIVTGGTIDNSHDSSLFLNIPSKYSATFSRTCTVSVSYCTTLDKIHRQFILSSTVLCRGCGIQSNKTVRRAPDKLAF
jgi:hypothetical protein